MADALIHVSILLEVFSASAQLVTGCKTIGRHVKVG